MATNKNQHYVPRCYLRPFTKGGKGQAINIFNIDRQASIQGASVKHQCSGNYFYGRDPDLEEAIQFIEGAYASTLTEIIGSPSNLTDDQVLILKRFWLLQSLRTEAASRRAAEMISGMGDFLKLEGEQFRFEIREAVIVAMRVFAEEMEIVDDLKVVIIRNKSRCRFITSDDPAILTNRWYQQDPRVQSMSFGYRAAGALFFMPLSPLLLCLGYDSDVYRLENKNGYVDIKHVADANAFNEHQYINCTANIYLRHTEDFESVRASFSEAKEGRPKQKHVYHYAVLDEVDKYSKRYIRIDPSDAHEHKEAIIHTQVVRAYPTTWPRQIRWKYNGSVYTNGSGIGYVRRNEALKKPEKGIWREAVGKV